MRVGFSDKNLAQGSCANGGTVFSGKQFLHNSALMILFSLSLVQ